MNQLIRAFAFAADKHRNQRRKDANSSPYINHPIALANGLANEGHVDDEVLLIAAILHDTIEDTETSNICQSVHAHSSWSASNASGQISLRPEAMSGSMA